MVQKSYRSLAEIGGLSHVSHYVLTKMMHPKAVTVTTYQVVPRRGELVGFPPDLPFPQRFPQHPQQKKKAG